MVKATKANTPDALSVYDTAGLRVAEKVNDVWRFLIYDIGGKMVAEYGGLQATDDGGVKYVLSDWQGSSRAVTSNSGFVRARMDYTAYGEEIQAGVGQRTVAQGFGVANNLRQRYGLTERDQVSGLDHTWFRKHENRAGRWTSPDPYNGSMYLGDPQSFNRFSYVSGQPTNFIDPSGLNAPGSICVINVFYTDENGTHRIVIWGTVDRNGNCQDNNAGTVQVYGGWDFFPTSSGTPVRNPFDPHGPGIEPGGGGVDITRNPTPPKRCTRVNDTSGGGDFNLQAIGPTGIGPTGGLQVGNNNIYPYYGIAVGTPGKGAAITVSTTPPTPGYNLNVQGGAVMGVTFNATIDTSGVRPALRSLVRGSLGFGGMTPGVSGSVVYVHKVNYGCALEK